MNQADAATAVAQIIAQAHTATLQDPANAAAVAARAAELVAQIMGLPAQVPPAQASAAPATGDVTVVVQADSGPSAHMVFPAGAVDVGSRVELPDGTEGTVTEVLPAGAVAPAKPKTPRRFPRGIRGYKEDVRIFRQADHDARAAAQSGDNATAQELLTKAQAIADRYPDTQLSDDLAYTRSLVTGVTGEANTPGGDVYVDIHTGVPVDPSSANAVAIPPGQTWADTKAALAQVVANQPTLLDELVGAGPSVPLASVCPPCAAFWPRATVGQALTVLGGYTSAIGITEPQSGADEKAKTDAKKSLDDLPWPLGWIFQNPGKAIAIGLAGVGTVAYGPAAVRWAGGR